MKNFKEILLSIDQSLKSISISLERIGNQSSFKLSTQVPKPERNYESEIVLNNKESILFMKITDVYMEEERARIESRKNKKAARRLSVNIGEELVEFFTKELYSQRIEVERSKIGGLIVFSFNGIPIAVLKYLTDLGYSRSERFYELVNEIQILAEKEFGVENENVFFIIASLRNGIEKSFVEKITGQTVDSIADFLTNKKQVWNFLDKYIGNIPAYEDPTLNVYILASDLHPNVLANAILDDLEGTDLNYYSMIDNLNHYEWFSFLGILISRIKWVFDTGREITNE